MGEKRRMQSTLKKLTWSIIFLAGCQVPTDAPERIKHADVTLAGDIAKASYSIGYTVGENIGQQFPDSIELEAFVQGTSDGVRGTEHRVGHEAGQRALAALNEKREVVQATKATAAQSAGTEFLAENGKRKDVVTLPSGLQYEVLTTGDGPIPAATDTVVTHYHGTLITGEVFDSSVARGEPAAFPVNRVIAGWTEALQLMAVGSKWRLYIPPDLAYKNRPPPRSSIPPNATLIFEVELLEIQ